MSIVFCGGAVFWNGTNGTLTGCTFINNAIDYGGGAVHWDGANGTLLITLLI